MEDIVDEPIYPNSQIPTDTWIDKWIKRYKYLSTTQDRWHDSFTRKIILPISQINKQSIDLKVSLQMLLQEVTTFAEAWTDVNRRINDRRSFPTFLAVRIVKAGLAQDNDISVSNQPNRWSSLQASSYDVVHLPPELTSDPNWVMANKYYGRSLSLMRLLQKIRTESPDGFSQEQARMMEPFLGHLIMIQQEQRAVVFSFSKHLEQLRNLDAASSLAFSSNAADDDGDRGKCPLILSKQPTEYYMWQHKHLFDSLYIISRASTWLLKKLKDSSFTSSSFIEESEILVEFIGDFISKLKKSKELLGHHLDNLIGVPEDEMMQMVLENKEILDHFGNHIQCLQQEGVGEGSVIEKLLGCLGDVCKISMDDYGEKDRLSSLDIEYEKAVHETMELIEEARKTLDSDRFLTLSGGSALGNVTLWRILFESSVAGLRLDLTSKKHGEAIKLGETLLDERRHDTAVCLLVDKYRNELHAKISLLLSDGNRVLLDFVAMHRTVAEITYMLGDAFTTGGAGMNDLHDETSAPGSSSK
ncbi:hypothetical protein MKW94_009557, partial [Papaver nudicaule]|nr:hypothetical protein [Papaver nudicaule]